MAALNGSADPRGVMGGIRARVALVAAMAALAAAPTLPLGLVFAAAPNQLDGPLVSPTQGDTTTTFSFSVHYLGKYPATSVSAAVGTRIVVLSLVSGIPTNGTYAGSGRLPAGTWSVTFNAIATQGNPPSISGGTVRVAGPTPSPRPSTAPTPTPAPAVKPVSKSTPAAVSGGGSVSQTSPAPATSPAARSTPLAAALAGSATNPPRGAGTDRTGGGGEITPDAFWPIMLAGFALIALFVAYYVFAMDRDRRRRALATEMAAAAAESLAIASPAEPPRPPAVWELDARLEDAPVGTVEFLPLQDGTAIGSPPTELAEPAPSRRGNPRLARISEARKHRVVEDRHTLLRRT
jgi:hypothetical protein